MNKQPRRHFSGPEKVAILKRHLLDKVPVSDLCDELQLYPNQVYVHALAVFAMPMTTRRQQQDCPQANLVGAAPSLAAPIG
jgi:transposase-like protein